MSRRYGITIPFAGRSLAEHRPMLDELAAAGYSDLWSSEVDGTDGFTPLVLASAWAPAMRLGVAIVPAYTRGPALLAQSVAAMAEAAPGRFSFGVGTSSDVIVERWNGLAFDKPYERVRDTLRFLRAALAGEKIDRDYETFSVHGFRLARPPAEPPPLYLAALRPGMLRLAAKEADGVILNWLSADDLTRSLAEFGGGKEVVARIFVVAEADEATARRVARRMIAAYLSVPAYAAFHRWLGRGPQLQAMWDLWYAGDRASALEAIPDEVVDALVVHGDPEACRSHIERYVENGVTVPVLAVVTAGADVGRAACALGPSS